MKKSRLLGAVCASIFSIVILPSQAAVIFDNFSGTSAENYNEQNRSVGFTWGTVLNVLSTTLVNDIALRYRANNDMNLTLGIWDSALGGQYGSLNWAPNGNTLLFSQKQSITTGATLDYITFSGVDFTFLENHRYDIGVWGDTGSLYGSWDYTNGSSNVNTAQGPFESINTNANIRPFSSDEGYAGVDPHIQLITTSTVPIPAAVWLFGSGLLGLIGIARRKKA